MLRMGFIILIYVNEKTKGPGPSIFFIPVANICSCAGQRKLDNLILFFSFEIPCSLKECC